MSKFKDAEGHWAESSINRLSDQGIISGYEDGTIRPNDNITRAEVFTVIARIIDREK